MTGHLLCNKNQQHIHRNNARPSTNVLACGKSEPWKIIIPWSCSIQWWIRNATTLHSNRQYYQLWSFPLGELIPIHTYWNTHIKEYQLLDTGTHRIALQNIQTNVQHIYVYIYRTTSKTPEGRQETFGCCVCMRGYINKNVKKYHWWGSNLIPLPWQTCYL